MEPRSTREQLIENCRWLFNKDVQVITFVTSKLDYVAAVLSKDCNLESVAGKDCGLNELTDFPRKSEIEEKLIVKALSLSSTDEAVNFLNEAIEEEIGSFLGASRDEKGWELHLIGSRMPLGDPHTLCERVKRRCAGRVPVPGVEPSLVDGIESLKEETSGVELSLVDGIVSLKEEIAQLRKSGAQNQKSAPNLHLFPPGDNTSTSNPADTRSMTPSCSGTSDTAEVGDMSEPPVMRTWNKLKSIHEQHEWLFNQHLLGDKRMERYVRQDLTELAASILAYLGVDQKRL